MSRVVLFPPDPNVLLRTLGDLINSSDAMVRSAVADAVERNGGTIEKRRTKRGRSTDTVDDDDETDETGDVPVHWVAGVRVDVGTSGSTLT